MTDFKNNESERKSQYAKSQQILITVITTAKVSH